MTNLTEGSVKVKSTLSVGNQSLVESIANALTSSLASGQKIGGFTIFGTAVGSSGIQS